MDKVERMMIKRAVLGTVLAWFVVAMAGLIVLGLSGCAQGPVGPTAQEEAQAVELVWGRTLAMEFASAPRIVWFDDSTCLSSATWNGITVRVSGSCETSLIDDSGIARIGWKTGDKISDTDFPITMAQWHAWLMSSRFSDADAQHLRNVLIIAGM